MNGVDWRAQMREAGVERRQSPPSRPDRGYVEQPEERQEPTQLRRRIVTVSPSPASLRPPVPLISLADMDEHAELLDELTRPDPKPAANDAAAPMPPAPEKQTMNPPSESRPERDQRMLEAIQKEIDRPVAAKKKRQKYNVVSDETKLKAVKEHLEKKRTQAAIARDLDVSQTTVAKWVERYQETGSIPGRGGVHQKTMLSPPSAPVSRVASIRNGARTFEQVSAELSAKLAEVVALKRELRDMLADN